jgi:hypothetical protein
VIRAGPGTLRARFRERLGNASRGCWADGQLRCESDTYGQGAGAGFVVLGLQTGRVQTRHGLARQVRLRPIEPGTKLAASGAPGCPEGASAVPKGGKRGGIQRSALWQWWDKRFAISADGVGQAIGTFVKVARRAARLRSACSGPKWPNCLVSEGAWGRISGLRARVTTLTLVTRALAWFFPLPVSAPQDRRPGALWRQAVATRRPGACRPLSRLHALRLRRQAARVRPRGSEVDPAVPPALVDVLGGAAQRPVLQRPGGRATSYLSGARLRLAVQVEA